MDLRVEGLEKGFINCGYGENGEGPDEKFREEAEGEEFEVEMAKAGGGKAHA